MNNNPKLVLEPNMAPIQSDYRYLPFTKDELKALPFCNATKAYLRSAKSVNMVPSEYFWYGDNWFTVDPAVTPDVLKDIRLHTEGAGWNSMSVRNQCELFGLELLQTNASDFAGIKYQKKPYAKAGSLTIEQFALECYKAQGWDGYFDEGTMNGVFVHMISSKVEAANEVFFRWDEEGTQVGGDALTQGQINALRIAISSVSDSDIVNSLEKVFISSQRGSNKARLPLDPAVANVICKVWGLLGPERVFKIMEAEMTNFGAGGWPDLLVTKGNEFKLVEVKSKTDRFHKNQALWLRNYWKPLKLPLLVLHFLD